MLQIFLPVRLLHAISFLLYSCISCCFQELIWQCYHYTALLWPNTIPHGVKGMTISLQKQATGMVQNHMFFSFHIRNKLPGSLASVWMFLNIFAKFHLKMFLKPKEDFQWQQQPRLGNYDERKWMLMFCEVCNGCLFYFLANLIKIY